MNQKSEDLQQFPVYECTVKTYIILRSNTYGVPPHHAIDWIYDRWFTAHLVAHQTRLINGAVRLPIKARMKERGSRNAKCMKSKDLLN